MVPLGVDKHPPEHLPHKVKAPISGLSQNDSSDFQMGCEKLKWTILRIFYNSILIAFQKSQNCRDKNQTNGCNSKAKRTTKGLGTQIKEEQVACH